MVAWLRNASSVFAGALLALLVVWALLEVRVGGIVKRWQEEARRQFDTDMERMQREFKP